MLNDDAADTTGPTGSAADEAVRLVDALRDLLTGPGSEHFATGAAECQVCPLCRLMTLLREADPQAVGRAAESVVSVVSAAATLAEPFLRSLVDTAISTAQAAADRSQTTDSQTTDSQTTDSQTTDKPEDPR